MGRIWYVEASVVGVGDVVRVRRLSAGETVKSVPSRVRDVGATVCRRILHAFVSETLNTPNCKELNTYFAPIAAVNAVSSDTMPVGPTMGVATGTLPAIFWRLCWVSAILVVAARAGVSSCVKNRAFENAGGPFVGLR